VTEFDGVETKIQNFFDHRGTIRVARRIPAGGAAQHGRVMEMSVRGFVNGSTGCELGNRSVAARSHARCGEGSGKRAAAQSAINALGENSAQRESPRAVLERCINTIDSRFLGDVRTSIDTGLKSVNEELGGGLPYKYILVGGAPSHGKTTFALQAAFNACQSGVGTAIYSYEMTPDDIMFRGLSMAGSLENTAIDTGKLDDSDWPKLTLGTMRIDALIKGGHLVSIDNSAGKTRSQLALI
jgi:replicative DNA helicase